MMIARHRCARKKRRPGRATSRTTATRIAVVLAIPKRLVSSVLKGAVNATNAHRIAVRKDCSGVSVSLSLFLDYYVFSGVIRRINIRVVVVPVGYGTDSSGCTKDAPRRRDLVLAVGKVNGA